MALYKGLLGILDHDSALFIGAIEQLLKVIGRQVYHTSMENIFCLEAHALAELYRSTGGDIDLTNFKLPWDAEFDALIRNNTDSVIPYDLSQANTGLNRWVHTLPRELLLGNLGL